MEPLKAQIQSLEGAYLLDCNAYFTEIGADENRDFHDTLHYNAAGAIKFSRFLGNWIKETLDISPAHGQNTTLWQERADYLNRLAAQPLVPKETE